MGNAESTVSMDETVIKKAKAIFARLLGERLRRKHRFEQQLSSDLWESFCIQNIVSGIAYCSGFQLFFIYGPLWKFGMEV